LMCNDENIFRCLEIARTRCLSVWVRISEDQIKRYHQDWRLGRQPKDEGALFLFLVAIGSRYVRGVHPNCADANLLFTNARNLLLEIVEPRISVAGLEATYVMVFSSNITVLITYVDNLWFYFLEPKG